LSSLHTTNNRLEVWHNELHVVVFKQVGLIALADAFRGSKVLSVLDISNNELRAEGAALVAEALGENT
jgi:hypothetical protein